MNHDPETKLVDGPRKAAIVLLSVNQILAAEVLGKLPRELVDRATLAIANAENLTRAEQESILNEFKSEFNSRPLMQPAGPETARELLERTLDQEDVVPATRRMEVQSQAGPFAFLHGRHADDIRRLLADEHPQTVAVITAQLPPNLAADVLAGFEAGNQADILGRLAQLGPTDVEVLSEIAALLKGRMGRMPVRTGGMSRAAAVLRETVPSTTRSVLQSLDNMDSSLAQGMRDSLFAFSEISSFDETTFKLVLQESDHCQWSVALKGCSEALRQRVFKCLPDHLAQALKDEMNSIGPLRLSEIKAVQRQIAEVVLTLESENRIERMAGDARERKSAAV